MSVTQPLSALVLIHCTFWGWLQLIPDVWPQYLTSLTLAIKLSPVCLQCGNALICVCDTVRLRSRGQTVEVQALLAGGVIPDHWLHPILPLLPDSHPLAQITCKVWETSFIGKLVSYGFCICSSLVFFFSTSLSVWQEIDLIITEVSGKDVMSGKE